MSELIVLNGCRTVQLTNGKNTLVDEADWAKVANDHWQAINHGRYAHSYARVDSKRVGSCMHRILLSAPKGMVVDHRNGDGLDNRRDNLRVCTVLQNAQNRRTSRGTSRFKGVFRKDSKWAARIRVPRGIYKWLGVFESEESAARAYDCEAVRIFGEFACTNAELFGDY